MEIMLKLHPPVLRAKELNNTKLIIQIKNDKRGLKWFEANIELPPELSFTPDHSLRVGRTRLGILRKNETIEKYIKIYASQYTKENTYKGKITIFSFDRNGIIDERKDEEFLIECKKTIEVIE